MQLVQFPLDLADLLLRLGRVSLRHTVQKERFFLPCELGHSPQIVQHDGSQLALPDIVAAARFFAPIAVGAALEVVVGVSRFCPRAVETHGLSTVSTVDQTGK